jgi:hypothetical protein
MLESAPIESAGVYGPFSLALSGSSHSRRFSGGGCGLPFLDLADTARQFVGRLVHKPVISSMIASKSRTALAPRLPRP